MIPEVEVLSAGTCTDLTQAAGKPFHADDDVLSLSVRDALTAVQAGMVGTWKGTAIAPEGWVGERWNVDLELRADGTYQATGSGSSEPTPAFYYGSDEPCPLKRWRVGQIGLDGAMGEIDIAFQYDGECGLAGFQGKLEHIELDDAQERMRFEFVRDDGYGPVTYDLFRACDED